MGTGHQIARVFYAHAKHDPVLSRVYPKHLRCAIESLGAFLTQLLGGPCEYSERRSSLSLREAHLRFKIGPPERDAWLRVMDTALQEVQIEEPSREALRRFFEEYSAYLVNVGQVPSQHVSAEWAGLRMMEETVAAIRAGDGRRALELADSPVLQAYFDRDRGAFLSLLALMMGSPVPGLLDYVHQKLVNDPGITRERHAYRRTLLHDAAGTGNVATVKLLLRLGADPNATRDGGHTPLYSVGNECSVEQGAEVVHLLAAAGADVNACGGVKHCTPLHMAARRGNVAVAQALLDCGADIEARDSKGDSPLRRAINCRQKAVVAFLLSRGAATEGTIHSATQ